MCSLCDKMLQPSELVCERCLSAPSLADGYGQAADLGVSITMLLQLASATCCAFHNLLNFDF